MFPFSLNPHRAPSKNPRNRAPRNPPQEYNQKVVLSAARAKAATKDVLATHNIARDRSDDLLEAAGAGGADGKAVAAHGKKPPSRGKK